jgi:hypothetical protein
MRSLSLFLACLHLNSGTNLRECEDQSWFKVQAVPVFRFDWRKMSSRTPGWRPLVHGNKLIENVSTENAARDVTSQIFNAPYSHVTFDSVVRIRRRDGLKSPVFGQNWAAGRVNSGECLCARCISSADEGMAPLLTADCLRDFLSGARRSPDVTFIPPYIMDIQIVGLDSEWVAASSNHSHQSNMACRVWGTGLEIIQARSENVAVAGVRHACTGTFCSLL